MSFPPPPAPANQYQFVLSNTVVCVAFHWHMVNWEQVASHSSKALLGTDRLMVARCMQPVRSGRNSKDAHFLLCAFSPLPSQAPAFSFLKTKSLFSSSTTPLENRTAWQTHAGLIVAHRCLELVSIFWFATVVSPAWVTFDQEPCNTSHIHLI